MFEDEDDFGFANRKEAGRKLAERLAHLKHVNPVVVALPRGGVTVGYEVAKALDAPLDIALVRKIGAPGQEEYGIGAVCDGPQPIVELDEHAVKLLRVPSSYIEAEKRRQLAEIERRRRLWLGEQPRVSLAGRTAIVVDDGVATGGTMRAALRSLRRQKPRHLVMAVPVAPPGAFDQFAAEADEVVILATPSWFYAIGQFYADFHQLADDEVINLMKEAKAFGQTLKSGRTAG